MKINLLPSSGNYFVISHHGIAEVLENDLTKEKSLHSASLFNSGDVIQSFSAGIIQNFPTYLTIQVDEEKHITLEPSFLQYTNHSCDPNVFFDTTNFELIALKKIEPGDELTFFYPSTEWKMDQHFNCTCGANNCLHQIKGAAFIAKKILNTYRLTSYILSKLKETTSA